MKTHQKIQSVLALIFVTSLLSLLASCGGSSDTAATTSGTGRVSLLITDGPTTDFDRIDLTLESVSLLCEDDDDADALDGDDDGCKEVVLFDETRVINLLALQNFSNLLSTTTIPAYEYSKIRLQTSKIELIKLNPDGTVSSIDIAKLPAGGKIDLNPRGSFDVTNGGHLMIELDVDAEKSIHIVETGNGKFIFRPVIFVNILGAEDLKLVVLNGKVLDKTDTGFQLCEVDALVADDSCMNVLTTADTVVHDHEIVVVAPPEEADEEDIATVLARAGYGYVDALHIVIASADVQEQNLAMFTGQATSIVDVGGNFEMLTDDDNDVVAPLTALPVAIADGARVFDKKGTVVDSGIIVDGTDIDVFGLAVPDLDNVANVKAAFAIINNDIEEDKLSGVIAGVDVAGKEITVTVVTDVFSGDVCADVEEADMFQLETVADKINTNEISINDLLVGMSVDVYGEDDGLSCLSAEVVLVTEN